MKDRVGNWNKTRTNSFFGHRVGAYLESLVTHGYLFHSLIFPHSLRRIKDFEIQLTNSAVFAEIYIFLERVLFPTWTQIIVHLLKIEKAYYSHELVAHMLVYLTKMCFLNMKIDWANTINMLKSCRV